MLLCILDEPASCGASDILLGIVVGWTTGFHHFADNGHLRSYLIIPATTYSIMSEQHSNPRPAPRIAGGWTECAYAHAGVRVDLSEVEEVLQGHDSVVRAACRVWDHPQRPGAAACTSHGALQPTACSSRCAKAATSLQSAAGAMPAITKDVLQVIYVSHLLLAELPCGHNAGGSLVAYVQLHPTAPMQAADASKLLQQHCACSLLPAAVPSDFTLLADMPVSAAGKVQRSLLQSPAWVTSASFGAESPGAAAVQSSEAMAAQQAGAAAVSSDQTFAADRYKGGWEMRVMQVFMNTLQDPALEPTHDVFARGCDSLIAADMAQQLGIDVRLILAFHSARELARQLSISKPTNVEASPGDLAPASTFETKRKAAGAGRQTQEAAVQTLAADAPIVPQLLHAEKHGGGRVSEGPRAALGGWVLMPGGHSLWCPPADESISPAVRDLSPPAKRACLHEDDRVCNIPQEIPSRPAEQHAKYSSSTCSQRHACNADSDACQQLAAEHAWKVALRNCIDAAPVVLCQPLDEYGNGQQQAASEAAAAASAVQSSWQEASSWRSYAFACSHGGDVLCVDVAAGHVLWRTTVPERADVGLALFQNLQVSGREHCASKEKLMH